ncbi:MAG: stage II sporulation protein P [Oscillospiraceae bacterium]|nr:stage II sporulation protein P [Oscillospiraceae bacterium]
MKKLKLITLGVLAALCLYLFTLYLGSDSRSVFVNTMSLKRPETDQTYPTDTPLDSPAPAETEPPVRPTIVPTTISGGLVIKNSSDYTVNAEELLSQGCPITLEAGVPQILIIHTHSSEAYSPAGLDKYEDLGTNRTLDTNYNVIRIGNELTEIFQSYGLNVIHDTGVYDYPSYTGSYNRSCEAIEKYLAENPSIQIVIDLHRDALCSDEITYKTQADEDGVCASQIMILVGSDASGLEHPDWQQNLRLALYLQNAVYSKYPSLMRPVQLVSYRYNQHLTHGSMILEVGSNGNTLQEALAAIRLFGNTAGPSLAELVR